MIVYCSLRAVAGAAHAASIGQLFGYAYGVALFASQQCYLPFGLYFLVHFWKSAIATLNCGQIGATTAPDYSTCYGLGSCLRDVNFLSFHYYPQGHLLLARVATWCLASSVAPVHYSEI